MADSNTSMEQELALAPETLAMIKEALQGILGKEAESPDEYRDDGSTKESEVVEREDGGVVVPFPTSCYKDKVDYAPMVEKDKVLFFKKDPKRSTVFDKADSDFSEKISKEDQPFTVSDFYESQRAREAKTMYEEEKKKHPEVEREQDSRYYQKQSKEGLVYGKDEKKKVFPVSYVLQKTPIPASVFSKIDSKKHPEHMVEMVKKQITREILQKFGGSSRVKEIAVSDGFLYVNGICYAPSIEVDVLEQLPLDVASYVKSRKVAALFDWQKLKHMPKLTIIAFEDLDFVLTYVASDLGLGRRFGVSSLFRVCPSLIDLYIGSEHIPVGDRSGEEAKVLREKLIRHKRFNDLADASKLYIYSKTGSLHTGMTRVLKDYASNKGNKSLLRYGAGLLVGGTLWASTLAVKATAHIVGETGGAVKTIIEDKR